MNFSYQATSPVLFVVFNRPEFTQRVFDSIRAARPPRLYIAADGPRPGNDKDVELCRQTRAIAAQVDWDCTVQTFFSEGNKGCKVAVSGAISWFFEHEEEGIILEDDCVPNGSFFYFCDTLLEKYRADTRIHAITGNNQQHGRKWGNASYYFSQRPSIWGWATWRRAWQHYDAELTRYTRDEAAAQLRQLFNDRFLEAEWMRIFDELKAGKIDTWDYQLIFIGFFENTLCITPNVNMVSNIGFGDNATHTFDPRHPVADLPTETLHELVHPVYFTPEKAADYYMMDIEHDLSAKWRRYNKRKRRFARWVKSLLK